jgi:hypothetical protein
MVRIGESYKDWYKRVVQEIIEYDVDRHINYRRLYEAGGLYIHKDTYKIIMDEYPGTKNTELYKRIRGSKEPELLFLEILNSVS